MTVAVFRTADIAAARKGVEAVRAFAATSSQSSQSQQSSQRGGSRLVMDEGWDG